MEGAVEREMSGSVGGKDKEERLWAEEFGSFNLVSEMTESFLRYLTFHRIC